RSSGRRRARLAGGTRRYGGRAASPVLLDVAGAGAAALHVAEELDLVRLDGSEDALGLGGAHRAGRVVRGLRGAVAGAGVAVGLLAFGAGLALALAVGLGGFVRLLILRGLLAAGLLVVGGALVALLGPAGVLLVLRRGAVALLLLVGVVALFLLALSALLLV